MANKKLKLSDTQLAHIRRVEADIAWIQERMVDCQKNGFIETEKAYAKRVKSLQSRIAEIQAGVHFGVSVVR